MEVKEVKEAIDESIKGLKEEAQGALRTANSALEEGKKALKELEGKASTDDVEKLKNVVEDLEKQLTKSIDEAIVKMNNAGTKNAAPETFESVLSKALEENTDNIKKFERKEIKNFSIEMDMKAVGSFGINNVTGPSQWSGIQRQGIITNQNTATHVRSLINVLPAGPGTDFYFMRENGVGEGSIAPTSEATSAATPTTQATGLKPQFDLDLVEASVKFETIAGWMLMSRKAMNNIPGLMAYLNMRLPEKLWDVEDSQILYGNGTSPNIKGILTAGNFVASTAPIANVLVEKIIKDMSLLEDTYKRLATGIAMRPADYYSFFLNKAAGSGEYDLPQGVSFVGGVLYILGVPVAKTTALTTNDYVVGDFQNGTELYVQEAMKIEFFEQDGNNVRTNQVTVRIEETVALPVYGPDYFIKGTSALA